MGGSIDYIRRDGSRLTPWMYFVIERANREFKAKFGCELLVTSGIRTNAEQTAIFLSKYRVQWTGNGPYGDVRWWKGKRYVRTVSGGTVAAPGKSNHEIQGTRAAVDLRDSGRDAGVSRGNNPRADWLKANARRLGLEPEGYGFGEPWHYAIPDIFRTPPAAPSSGGNSRPAPVPAPVSEEEDEDMPAFKIRKTTNTDTNAKKYPIRFALSEATSGYWEEMTDSHAGNMNTLAAAYGTGDAIEQTSSVFSNAREAHAAVRARRS